MGRLKAHILSHKPAISKYETSNGFKIIIRIKAFLAFLIIASCLFSNACLSASSNNCYKATSETMSLLNSDDARERSHGYRLMVTGMKEDPSGGWYNIMEDPQCEYILIELLKKEVNEMNKYIEIYGNYEFNDIASHKKETENFLGVREYFYEGYPSYYGNLQMTVAAFDNPDIVEPLVGCNHDLKGLEKYGDRTIVAVINRLNNKLLFDNSMFISFTTESMEYIRRNGEKYNDSKYYEDIASILLRRMNSKNNKGKYLAILTIYDLNDETLNDIILNYEYSSDYEPVNEEVSIIKKNIIEKRKSNVSESPIQY